MQASLTLPTGVADAAIDAQLDAELDPEASVVVKRVMINLFPV